MRTWPHYGDVCIILIIAQKKSQLNWVKAAAIMVGVQLFAVASAFGFVQHPSVNPEPPFVICSDQQYALCAEADCFVYNGLSYCQCDILTGNSISLQLSYSTPDGERDVCSVNQQGATSGYMVSTFSFPTDVEKGGSAAVYTCPGRANKGEGVKAPVAYGQCDGGICFKSTSGQSFPGFTGQLAADQIICSCPISTDATTGSSNKLGYQIFGQYHPAAPKGSRCDANACALCSVPDPTANGASLMVGAPTGSAEFLTLKLDGSVPPINQCLCKCSKTRGPKGSITCTVSQRRHAIHGSV